MIVGSIIDIFGRVLFFIISLLPTSVVLPAQISTALQEVFNYAFMWDWLLPISTLLIILTASVAFYTAIFGVKGVLWLLNLMRGSGA